MKSIRLTVVSINHILQIINTFSYVNFLQISLSNSNVFINISYKIILSGYQKSRMKLVMQSRLGSRFISFIFNWYVIDIFILRYILKDFCFLRRVFSVQREDCTIQQKSLQSYSTQIIFLRKNFVRIDIIFLCTVLYFLQILIQSYIDTDLNLKLRHLA